MAFLKRLGFRKSATNPPASAPPDDHCYEVMCLCCANVLTFYDNWADAEAALEWVRSDDELVMLESDGDGKVCRRVWPDPEPVV